MKKSDRIKPVIKVAEGREQQAAASLGKALSVVNERKERLAALMSYHREYQDRLQQQSSTGIGVAQLLGFRQFLDNLAEAIRQQEGLVRQAEHELDARRAQWFGQRGKVQALDNVAAHYAQDEQRLEDRKIQHETDALALRFVKSSLSD